MPEATTSDMTRSVKGRQHTIGAVLEHLEEQQIGKKKNLFLVGPLHIGKTVLLKEIVRQSKDCVYVDFSHIGLTPEEFAIDIIRKIGSWHLGRSVTLAECKLDEAIGGIVYTVENELQKIKPDHRLLIKTAFLYADAVGKKRSKKVVLCLDEFWKILDLNNFEQITDVVPLLRSVFSELPNTSFLFSGSPEILSLELSKTFGCEEMMIKGLNLRDIGDNDVYQYSFGVPLYAQAIMSRTKDYTSREAFLVETLWKQGVIYHACEIKLLDCLSRARGRALLDSILRVLSFSNGLRLSDVGRQIYRSAPVTKSLIERLVHADLLVKDGNLYLFKDPIMKFWYKHLWLGTTFDFIPDKAVLKSIEVDI